MNHGTLNAYQRDKCRCEICRAAWTTYYTAYRRRRRHEGVPTRARHGTVSTYTNHGCRCAECRLAESSRSAAYYDSHRSTILTKARHARILSHQEWDAVLISREKALSAARSEVTGELAELVHAQEKDQRLARVHRRPGVYSWDDVYGSGMSVPFRDWTDAVVDAMDRRREIDAWAAA